ncbi:hypothetical protein [Endozoicomonas sp. ONNA1]|uniref:hypothetical protein n=1 Tax=Endozoicomonas sp. ONNA1 TaxID=2828740 RepID=UPI00214779C7|nr:hypothetical protein [Endozoicomonas sp. ONNA1]
MKIETSQITKIALSELEALDPVTVILEDIGPRQGKINIECYGQAWSSYWGGMGDRTIAEFFCSCDEHYLAKNLSSVRSHIIDYDAIGGMIQKEIKDQIKSVIQDRREQFTTEEEAREKYDQLNDSLLLLPSINDEFELRENQELLDQIYGEEWWHSLPEKANPDYEYLCRIIKAVQSGLAAIKQDVAA